MTSRMMSIIAAAAARRGAGGGPYDPATDASVVQWLRSDELEGTASGAAVSRWPAAKGVDAITGGSVSPSYSASQQNGRGAVRYQNSGGFRYHRTESAFGPIPQPYTIWAVFRTPDLGFNNCYLWDSFLPGNSKFVRSNPNWLLSAGTSLSAAMTPDTAWHILRCIFDGANSSVAFDGATTATGDAGTGTLAGMFLGQSNAENRSPDDFLGELIVQSGAPVDTAAIWAYLNSRWAIY